MATLSFRDFDLNQTSITGRRNPNVVVDSFHLSYKIDPDTKQRTDEPDKYVVDIIARNRLQSVKLPLEAVSTEVAKKIQDALATHLVVKVNFGANSSTLRGKCYALLNNGRLYSGISCTATELNVVSIEAPDADDFDEIDLDLMN